MDDLFTLGVLFTEDNTFSSSCSLSKIAQPAIVEGTRKWDSISREAIVEPSSMKNVSISAVEKESAHWEDILLGRCDRQHLLIWSELKPSVTLFPGANPHKIGLQTVLSWVGGHILGIFVPPRLGLFIQNALLSPFCGIPLFVWTSKISPNLPSRIQTTFGGLCSCPADHSRPITPLGWGTNEQQFAYPVLCLN